MPYTTYPPNEARDHATVAAPPVIAMRKFGVQLEMICPEGQSPQNLASSLLTGIGIANEISGPFGRNYNTWQVKRDGSLSPNHRGAEIVSPIMVANVSSYDEIRRVASTLESAGYGVNRTCGMHVHINVADLPMHARQLVILRYAHLQSQIDAMLPPSRRSGANGFCQVMTPTAREALARNIDTGMERWPVMATQGSSSYDHYSATNIQHASSYGPSCRIEFRQAAATVNADKIIAWVWFLQEFVTEVARRAQGLTFGNAVPYREVYRQAPQPQTFGGRVPHMRHGSDADRAMTQLCTQGVITSPWARSTGIGDNVLRRIIVGFRRHGAGIITQRTADGPSYILSGATALPVERASVFAGTTLQPVPAPVAPPMPAPITMTRAAEFVAYPFNDGLSDSTIAWCNERRATFARRT